MIYPKIMKSDFHNLVFFFDKKAVHFGNILICHFPVSYTHLRAHETVLDLVCRLLLEKKKKINKIKNKKK